MVEPFDVEWALIYRHPLYPDRFITDSPIHHVLFICFVIGKMLLVKRYCLWQNKRIQQLLSYVIVICNYQIFTLLMAIHVLPCLVHDASL